MSAQRQLGEEMSDSSAETPSPKSFKVVPEQVQYSDEPMHTRTVNVDVYFSNFLTLWFTVLKVLNFQRKS